MAKPLFAVAKAFTLANQSHAKKKATASPRRMSLCLGEGRQALKNLAIFFLPILALLKAHFLKPINFGSLDFSCSDP